HLDPAATARLAGMSFQGGMGYGADRLYGACRTRGYVSAAKAAGTFAPAPLARAEIAIVPADATWACLGKCDPRGIFQAIREAVEAAAEEHGLAEGMDPLEMLETASGFDLDKDLFGRLGDTWGAYASESSGGGGLLSAVAFVKVADEKGLDETLRDL